MRSRRLAEVCGEGGGGCVWGGEGDEGGGEFGAGSGTTADNGFAGKSVDGKVWSEGGAEAGGEGGGARGECGGSGANHLESGNFVEGAANAGTEGGGESGEGHFVDAKGAKEWIAADLFDEGTFTGDDAGLRAAEKLVATEGNDVDTGVEAVFHDGLVHADGAKVGQAAGAEVFEDGNPGFAAEGNEFGERGAGGEAGDAEVGEVDAEEEAGVFVDGALVVGDASAVGGAHFAEDGAALIHDVGNAEAVADFDEFAARDDDFEIFGERVEGEEDCGSIVIDDDGGFGGGGEGKEAGDVGVAFAASARGEIEFEVGVALGGRGDGLSCGGGERGTAEIGVEDDAGGVDDAAERGGEGCVNIFEDEAFDCLGSGGVGGRVIAFARGLFELSADLGEGGAGGLGDEGAAGVGDGGGDGGAGYE